MKPFQPEEDILKPSYELFVDGSPGPKVKPGFSGWGLVLMASATPVFQACGTTVDRCTSQAIELEAVNQGLAYIHRAFPGYITLWTDSKYTADSLSRLPEYEAAGWLTPKGKPIANTARLRIMWDYLCGLELLSRVTIRWTKGHDGNIGNDLADYWSKEASSKGTNWYGGSTLNN
jgi:ribonuclease HI